MHDILLNIITWSLTIITCGTQVLFVVMLWKYEDETSKNKPCDK